MENIYLKTSMKCSKIITYHYTTSFRLGAYLLPKKLRTHIYNIYAFVRLGDEIVDAPEAANKEYLLEEFITSTHASIKRNMSSNPVLQSFQYTAKIYGIEKWHIDTFFRSMKTDIRIKDHNRESYNDYILGSAQVVGLMCLKVFCQKDEELYRNTKDYAMKLGSAFQKTNFLRDFYYDSHVLDRNYFPNLNDINSLNEATKKEIIEEIKLDFKSALEGIKKLPIASAIGVYLVYAYYLKLLKKLDATKSETIVAKRLRLSNLTKLIILIQVFIRIRLRKLWKL